MKVDVHSLTARIEVLEAALREIAQGESIDGAYYPQDIARRALLTAKAL